MGLLAAGRSARRLGAGGIPRIADVHCLVARVPVVLDELERARAHDLLDLLVGRSGRDSCRHHEGWPGCRAQRLEYGKLLGELDRECRRIERRDVSRMRHEEPAETILLSPPPER